MIVDRIAVTDHIQNFSIEREILGDLFDNEITEKTTILLVWHKIIDAEFLQQNPSVRAELDMVLAMTILILNFASKEILL